MNVTITAETSAKPGLKLGNSCIATPSFQITVRTSAHCTKFSTLAASASDAWSKAADLFGDTPCGITVTPGRSQ